MLDEATIEGLRIIKAQPQMRDLKTLISFEMGRAYADLVNEHDPFKIHRAQGALLELQTLLKIFDDLDLFVKQPDNRENPDPASNIYEENT